MARGFIATVGVMLVSAIFITSILGVPESSEANPAVGLKYYTGQGTPTAFNDYRSVSGFAYWRVNFTNSRELVVAGLWLSYKTPVANLPWKGELQINESDGGYKQYEVSLPSSLGNTKTYTEHFDGPQYMIVDANFSMSLFPATTESATLAMDAEQSIDPNQMGHTSYWANEDGWTPIKGYELHWTAIMEEIITIEAGNTNKGGSIDITDTLDCYKVLLAQGKSYMVTLDNPDRGSFAARLYSPDNILKNPLVEMTGKDPVKTMTFAPTKDGFYYIFVEYPNNIGALSYSVKVRTNTLPIPVASADKLVNVNQPAHFSAEGSSDPDNDPITYSWDFDATDGVTQESNKKSPTYSYKKGGTYTATLTVNDGKDSVSTTVKVRVNVLPVGNLSIQGISTLNETTRLNLEQEYIFNAAFVDPDGDNLTFAWDFGDNTTGKTQSVKHTYLDIGNFNYTVSLTVRDSGGNVSTSASLVFNKLPLASIVELKHAPSLNKKIELTALGSDPDGYVMEYKWDFDGDGKIDYTSQEATAEHTFTAVGTYNLTVFVVDNNGGETKFTTTFTIKKKAAAKQDYTLAIVGALVAVIIVVAVVVILKRKKVTRPAQGQSAAVAAAPPPPPKELTEEEKQKKLYESMYGPVTPPAPPPEPPQAPKPPPPPPPKPDYSIPGQRYQPVAQQGGGVSLVPPPDGGKGPVKATAKLVPPPKPV